MTETGKHRSTELLRGFTQYGITPLETHLPVQLEHLTPHCTISPLLLLVFYTALFFLSPPGARTYLPIQASARGHCPKGNWDFQTHTCASSSELLQRYSLVPR